MKNWFSNIHLWSLKLASSKSGLWVLLIFTFADASFFPLPSTTLFLLLIWLDTNRTFKYVLLVVLGTWIGAFAGYSIGHFAWIKSNGEYTALAQFLFNNIPGLSIDFYNKIDILYTKYDFWVLSIAATTPIPYGLFSISSGVFDINILVFCIATLISQGIKFIVLAFATLKLGHIIKKLASVNWTPVAIITTVGIVIVIFISNAFKILQ